MSFVAADKKELSIPLGDCPSQTADSIALNPGSLALVAYWSQIRFRAGVSLLLQVEKKHFRLAWAVLLFLTTPIKSSTQQFLHNHHLLVDSEAHCVIVSPTTSSIHWRRSSFTQARAHMQKKSKILTSVNICAIITPPMVLACLSTN